MVESYIKMKRKDYLKVCEMLEQIKSDMNTYESEENKEVIEAIKNKVSVIQNLLMEDC